MKTLIAAVAVLLVGCAESALWHADLSAKPVPVEISADLTASQRADIVDGINFLNDAVGVAVVEIVPGDGHPEAGEIGFDNSGLDETKDMGYSSLIEDRCTIALNSQERWAGSKNRKLAVAHEILHCLGYEHSEDSTDIMFAPADANKEVKPYMVADLLARIEGR